MSLYVVAIWHLVAKGRPCVTQHIWLTADAGQMCLNPHFFETFLQS